MLKSLTFKDKTLIIPLIFSFILVAIVFWIVLVMVEGNKPATSVKQVSSVPTNQVSIKKVIPDEPETLTAGIPHTFLVYFSSNVTPDQFSFNLTTMAMISDNYTKTPVPLAESLFSPNVISIKTLEPIKEQNEYILTVSDKHTFKTLSTTTYLSGKIQPTKVPNNNLTLKQYLPHETNNYLLDYFDSQNIYVFHFKYDPTGSEGIAQQYTDAKAQAIQFIQSKGVDINSIVIQYRSS